MSPCGKESGHRESCQKCQGVGDDSRKPQDVITTSAGKQMTLLPLWAAHNIQHEQTEKSRARSRSLISHQSTCKVADGSERVHFCQCGSLYNIVSVESLPGRGGRIPSTSRRYCTFLLNVQLNPTSFAHFFLLETLSWQLVQPARSSKQQIHGMSQSQNGEPKLLHATG